jgi:hypothetical protein
MPLTRGRILGYDNERMAFGFSMLNGSEEVECQISAAAMDELVGGPRGSYVDREAQFSLLRETIESLASGKFDASTIVSSSMLRIFAKDMPKATRRDDLASRVRLPSARPANSATRVGRTGD